MTLPKLESRDWIFIALGLLIIAMMGMRTVSNTDFWAHQAAGKAIELAGIKGTPDPLAHTTEGATWVNPSWLYHLIMYKLKSPVVITLLHILAVVGAFFVMVKTCTRWGGGLAMCMAMILSGWLMMPRFEPRPDTLTLIFPALYVAVLSGSRGGLKPWAILVPLQILWCNLSVSFQLGPFLVLAFAVEAWRRLSTEAESDPGAKKDFFLLIGLIPGLIIASMISPFGPGNLGAAAESWTNGVATLSSDWVSPFASQFDYGLTGIMVYAVLGVGACGLIFLKQKLPLGITILAIASAFLTVSSQWIVEIFAVLAFPFIVLSLNATGTFLGQRLDGSGEGLGAKAGMGVAGLAVLVSAFSLFTNGYYVASGSAAGFGLGVNEDIVPSTAMAVINSEEMAEELVNFSIDGGFIAVHTDTRKIFIDQRARLYGREFFVDMYDALNTAEPENWSAFDEKWKPRVFVINACMPQSGQVLRLLLVNRWVPTYFDGTTLVMAKQIKENAGLLTNSEIKMQGLQKIEDARGAYRDRLGGLTNAPIPPRLLGAARIFLEMRQYPQAHELYTLLAHGAPNMKTTWLNKGICELSMGRNDMAVASLERASKELPDNIMCWLNLFQAYKANKMGGKAESAFSRAEKIDKERATKFRNALKRAGPAEETKPPAPATPPAP